MLSELICTIRQKQLRNLKIKVWNRITELFAAFALFLFNFDKILILQPVGNLHLTFLPLLKIDGKPERHADRLTWLERSVRSTNKSQFLSTKIWLDVDWVVFCEEFVFGGSPARKVHICNY